ncbi:hypothetical protein EVG20_g10959, partial [Dentipellis fragilis]
MDPPAFSKHPSSKDSKERAKTPPQPQEEASRLPQRPCKPRNQHIPTEPESPSPLSTFSQQYATHSQSNGLFSHIQDLFNQRRHATSDQSDATSEQYNAIITPIRLEYQRSEQNEHPGQYDPEIPESDPPFDDDDSDDEGGDDELNLETLRNSTGFSSSDSDFIPFSLEESRYTSQQSDADTQDLEDERAAQLLVLPLHPYARPREEDITNLFQLVWAVLPPVPPIYKHNQLRGTKRPSEADCNLEMRLTKIVPLPQIFAPIEKTVAARLGSIPMDLNNPIHRDFAVRVFPWYTAMNVSRRIQSEVDTEDMVMNVLLRPAMAVAHAVLRDSQSHDSVPQDHHGPHVDPISSTHDPSFPFVSSAHGKKHAKPDGILVLSGEHPDEVTPLCLEVKTHAVISETVNPLDTVQTPIPGHPHGAYKFNMPSSPSDSDDHACSIMTQIWSQAVHWDAEYGILSSMQTVSFFVRRDDTLYISKSYRRFDEALFYVICWCLLAIEAIPSLELNLPIPDVSWWSNEVLRSSAPGSVLKGS